jgi:hypothetical protein
MSSPPSWILSLGAFVMGALTLPCGFRAHEPGLAGARATAKRVIRPYQPPISLSNKRPEAAPAAPVR